MTILERNKSVWSNVFWYVKVCLFWKCVQCTIHWDTNFYKFSFGQNKRYQKCSLFISRAPTHHSCTFNWWFLYDLKHKVHLCKTAWNSHFRFRFVLIKVYNFVQKNACSFWLQSVIIVFKIKIIEKPHTVLFPDLWFQFFKISSSKFFRMLVFLYNNF